MAGQVSKGTRAVAVVGVLAVLGAALVFLSGDPTEVTTSGPEVADAFAPATGTAPEAAAVVPPPAAAEPAAAASVPGPGDEPEAPADARAAVGAGPRFDVVRVTPDGAALVAGRAVPGARVTVMADDAALAEVEATQSGDFVAIFRAEPSGAPRTLTLGSKTATGERAVSAETVLLLPAGNPQPGAAGAAGAASNDDAGGATTAILDPEAGTVEVLPSGGQGSRGRVSLASISYGTEGMVVLAGFGTAGDRVRAYVDDGFAAEARVSSDGRWQIEIAAIDEGVYSLRIDQVDARGIVASRVETPFQRTYPPAPDGDAPGGDRSVTVQPGGTLWTIARTHYGQGVLYAQIFTANRGLIRDPDLIYPGQIFLLPQVEGAGPDRGPVVPLPRP